MIDTILNIDLDFLTQPYYEGNHYIVREWKSTTDFLAKAKNWITPEKIFEKLDIVDPIKGDSVASDKQVLFSWEKTVSKKIVSSPFRILNFDAHLDMYAINTDDDYYDIFSLANFNDYDSCIAPFKYKWVDRIDWVVPDYFTIEDIEKQFTFIKPIYRDGNLYELYVSDNFKVWVKIIKFSELKKEEYNIKYFSMVLNSDKCKSDDKMITAFRSKMKR